MLLPSVGATGSWKLKAPFDEKVDPELSYRCDAVRRISEMVAMGTDVKTIHYFANGLTEAEYKADVQADVAIITLSTSSGDWAYVPSSYVLGWPSTDGVPYAVVGMAVVLGALPNTIDPTMLTEKVKEVIKANLGMEPEITYATVSEVAIKSQEQHENLETARLANISEDKTNYQLLQETLLENERLRSLNQSLIDFIADQ